MFTYISWHHILKQFKISGVELLGFTACQHNSCFSGPSENLVNSAAYRFFCALSVHVVPVATWVLVCPSPSSIGNPLPSSLSWFYRLLVKMWRGQGRAMSPSVLRLLFSSLPCSLSPFLIFKVVEMALLFEKEQVPWYATFFNQDMLSRKERYQIWMSIFPSPPHL